jgi:DNA-binding transcriptional ArsR family regulator
MSDVFAALADETRRALLDRLFIKNGQSLTDLHQGMAMSRQAVAKHLHILETANLVSVHWQGREKLHYLNPVPLGDIVQRWVGKFEDARIAALTDFKQQIESASRPSNRSQPEEKRRAGQANRNH